MKGVETALTITLKGLRSPMKEGDVNGDGDINTGDVTAVYLYVINGDASGFAKDIADVNGDGDVNSADVVAIYTIIVGSNGASSKEFKAQMAEILKK